MAYKKKSKTTKKKYSEMEKLLYFFGQRDSKAVYEPHTKMGKLQGAIDKVHPCYKAGVIDGVKRRVKFVKKRDPNYKMKDDFAYQNLLRDERIAKGK